MSGGPPLTVTEIDPHGRPVRRGFPVRVARWVGRHPFLVLLVVTFLVLLGLGLDWCYLPNHPTLHAEKVESVTVRLGKYNPNPGFGPGYEQEPAQVTTDDPALIQPLLDAFRTAKRGEQHNCGDSGVITVRRTDGIVEEVLILPGHDERYYEYRLGSRINRIDRGPFLEALKALGLSSVKTVPPS
jgi:hypothetical protein